MKLSEAIEQLQAIQKAEGDIELVDLFEYDGCFGIDHDVWFEVVGVPNEDETAEHPHVIMNFAGRLAVPPPNLSIVDN